MSTSSTPGIPSPSNSLVEKTMENTGLNLQSLRSNDSLAHLPLPPDEINVKRVLESITQDMRSFREEKKSSTPTNNTVTGITRVIPTKSSITEPVPAGQAILKSTSNLVYNLQDDDSFSIIHAAKPSTQSVYQSNPATKFVTNDGLPNHLAQKLNYRSIGKCFNAFNSVALYEVIKRNTKQTFLEHCTKTCYELNYDTLALTYGQSRDNFQSNVVAAYKDSYAKQHTHSISGEQRNLCYYGYSPSDMTAFLTLNAHLPYVYLPLTVFATDAANGVRHDMLLIFNNTTKLFYWFDCKNREDYLPLSKYLPKNVLDIFFTNFADVLKLGFSYEASDTWMIREIFPPCTGLGDMDFVVSSAWCYIMMLGLNDTFHNPTIFLSTMYDMSSVERVHLLYTAILKMIDADYDRYVPLKSQIDFTADVVKSVPTEQLTHSTKKQESSTPSPTANTKSNVINTSKVSPVNVQANKAPDSPSISVSRHPDEPINRDSANSSCIIS
jgi:hypothetical protein